MVETVVALLMFVGAEIKEHRIQPSMSECLKGKRMASRSISENIEFKCIKSKAMMQKNIDGSFSIKALILE
mgnify:CR=1|jgi:hypothetical protein